MIALRFLELFKPISRVIPEVKPPERKVSFQNRLIWTLLALLIYFIMSEIPLYRHTRNDVGGDTFTAYRVIFASSKGTLMELGIGPIVTAGLIIQLLAGSDIISFDRSSAEDRGLFTTASKFFSIVMIIIQAALYIISGQYGAVTLTKCITDIRPTTSRGHDHNAARRAGAEGLGHRQRDKSLHCRGHHREHLVDEL